MEIDVHNSRSVEEYFVLFLCWIPLLRHLFLLFVIPLFNSCPYMSPTPSCLRSTPTQNTWTTTDTCACGSSGSGLGRGRLQKPIAKLQSECRSALKPMSWQFDLWNRSVSVCWWILMRTTCPLWSPVTSSPLSLWWCSMVVARRRGWRQTKTLPSLIYFSCKQTRCGVSISVTGRLCNKLTTTTSDPFFIPTLNPDTQSRMLLSSKYKSNWKWIMHK